MQHLCLRAAKQERAQHGFELSSPLAVPVSDGSGEACFERSLAPQQPRDQGVNDAPELAQMILDRRSREPEAELCGERTRRLRAARPGIFQHVCLVEDDRVEGLRGEDSIAELCRREGINSNLYYRWSKDLLEAAKKRLAGDTAREANSDEVKALRHEAAQLKEALAETLLENRLLKKSSYGAGGDDT